MRQHCFNIATDGTVIEHCNIIANPQTLGPIMSCFSKIEFRNVTCVAPESQNDQYWIEANCYNIACRDSRFVSENPMCVIKQVAKPGYISASTIVDNCQFTSAGCPEGGVVDFQEVPNTFYFTGNSELSDQDVHAVTWRQPNTAEFFTENRYFKLIPVDSQFNFCLARNTPNIITTLPESAHPFIRPDVPSQLLKQVAATIESCKRPDVETLVFAVDYGVQADGETDDSEALQRAVDATAALPKSALVLPGKIIKLNHTLNLPQAITIIGNGCPYLLGDESCDAFNGIGVQNVFLKNIAFKGFMSALNVQTEANETSQVVIDGCKFYNCTTTVIKCLSNKSGKANKTTLEVKNSLVSGRTAIDSNAAHSLLSNIWLSGSWLADNQAYFINRAGIMLAESILGVPGCHKGKMLKHRTTGEEKLWEYGDNMRWFDNYGNLIIKDMRFGGEGGGLCPVFNRSATATLFMQGGFLSLSNTYTKKGYVYFMEPPKAMVLIANNNIPGTTERSVWIKDPESASIDQGSIFISGPGVRLSVVRDEHGVMNAH